MRKTIGLLAYETTDQICKTFITAVKNELSKRNANLLCYIGDSLESTDGNKAEGNRLYDFVSKSRVDGLILMGGGVGQFVDQDKMEAFVRKFDGIPMTNISLPLNNVPSIIVDNYNGLYKLFEHLIDDHGYKKLAFIKGPDGHEEAEERLKAYKDVLQAKGIAFDLQLVAPGEFSPESGEEAVELFLDKRKQKPDVICCVDDDTAFGVLSALKKRNIKVPMEIAVTGFDNTADAAAVTPPLSTVGQPLEKQAARAVDNLFMLLEGRSVEKLETISTDVYLRESCGCMNPLVRDALEEHADNEDNSVSDINSLHEKISNQLLSETLELSNDNIRRCLSGLLADVENDTQINFIGALDDLIQKYKMKKKPAERLHRLMSSLRDVIPFIDNKYRSKVESLLHAGRVLIAESAQKDEIAVRIDEYNQFFTLSQVSESLNHVFDLQSMKEVILEEFPELHIDDFLLFLNYDEGDNTCTYAGGYLNETNFTGPLENQIQAVDLLGDEYLNEPDPYFGIIEPLFFGKEFLGIALFRLEPKLMETCDQLKSHLSSTLKRVFLLEERAETTRKLEAKDKQIMDLVSPMLESIRKVTELTDSKRKGMEDLTNATEESRSKIGYTNSIIKQVADNASNMLEMSTVIDDIAENVNVLAINAAIQSSHAGKYGAAFSVIASEIRNLSDSTAENARGISENLNTVITDIKTSNTASTESMKVFTRIDGLVAELKQSLEDIASAMNELSDMSRAIIQVMQK